jgi:trehalose 6-phosphate synthase/phosphatase
MRLVILSNLLPFTVSIKNGHPVFESSSGGLSTGLWSFLERAAKKTEPLEFLWVGWPGTSVEPSQVQEIQAGGEAYRAASVFLSEETVEKFYHGFCNKTLWPLFHYVPSLVRYEEEYWQEFQQGGRYGGYPQLPKYLALNGGVAATTFVSIFGLAFLIPMLVRGFAFLIRRYWKWLNA